MRDASVPAETEPAHDNLESAAAVVAAWCGEPLLHAGRGPRRRARARHGAPRRAGLPPCARSTSGLDAPEPGLPRGASRSCSASSASSRSRLAARSPPASRCAPHQVDALAGMLAALIGDEERGEEDAEDDEQRRRRRRRRRERTPTTTRTTARGRGRRRPTPTSDPERTADPTSTPTTRPSPPRRRATRSGRAPALPLQASDRVGQDGRRRRLRRGLPHGRRADPDASPAARRPVPARSQGAGLRPAPVGRDREGPAHPEPPAGHGRDLRVVHQAPPGPRTPTRTASCICDEAHTALGERTGATHPPLPGRPTSA